MKKRKHETLFLVILHTLLFRRRKQRIHRFLTLASALFAAILCLTLFFSPPIHQHHLINPISVCIPSLPPCTSFSCSFFMIFYFIQFINGTGFHMSLQQDHIFRVPVSSLYVKILFFFFK